MYFFQPSNFITVARNELLCHLVLTRRQSLSACISVCAVAFLSTHDSVLPFLFSSLVFIVLLLVNLYQPYCFKIWEHWRNDHGYTAILPHQSIDQLTNPSSRHLSWDWGFVGPCGREWQPVPHTICPVLLIEDH